MRKSLIIVSMGIFLVSMLSLAGCDKKGKACKKAYKKLNTCMKDLGMEKGIDKFGSEDKFVKECKDHFDEPMVKKMVDCASKDKCDDFYKCAFGVNPAQIKKAKEAAKKLKKAAADAKKAAADAKKAAAKKPEAKKDEAKKDEAKKAAPAMK